MGKIKIRSIFSINTDEYFESNAHFKKHSNDVINAPGVVDSNILIGSFDLETLLKLDAELIVEKEQNIIVFREVLIHERIK